MGQLGIIVVYVVALGALMYFFAIKPQKKQQKEQQQLMDSMEIGDYRSEEHTSELQSPQ